MKKHLIKQKRSKLPLKDYLIKRHKLLKEIEEMRAEIATLKTLVKKAQRRAMALSSALGISLIVVLGVDASGTTVADLIAKIISVF